MKEIILTQGKVALVDDEDYEWLNQWKWYFNGGYAARNINITNYKNRKTISMHSVINKATDGLETDHIDGNKLNNQKNNLRSCTHAENQKNLKTPKNNTSGYKGVYWNKRAKLWNVRITVNAKVISLGYFKSLLSAALSYDSAAKKYYGAFARTNF